MCSVCGGSTLLNNITQLLQTRLQVLVEQPDFDHLDLTHDPSPEHDPSTMCRWELQQGHPITPSRLDHITACMNAFPAGPVLNLLLDKLSYLVGKSLVQKTDGIRVIISKLLEIQSLQVGAIWPLVLPPGFADQIHSRRLHGVIVFRFRETQNLPVPYIAIDFSHIAEDEEWKVNVCCVVDDAKYVLTGMLDRYEFDSAGYTEINWYVPP